MATETTDGNPLAIPLEACRFAAEQSAEIGAAETSNGTTRYPVRMVARTGDALWHWYWGNVIHDMAGLQHADRIAIDHAHDAQQPLGFINQFDIVNGDLVLSGELVAVSDSDQVHQLVAKAKGGVPYQASIFFQALSEEDLKPGATALVNGRQINGPGVIIRQWKLRGMAMCLYGQDPNTSTELAARFGVRPIPEERSMSQNPNPPTQPLQPATKTGLDYLNEFGDQGAVWFAKGLSWDQATAQFGADQTANVKRLETELAAATERATKAETALAAATAEVESWKAKAANPLGETKPLSATEVETQLSGNTSGGQLSNLQKFAAAIKLPN